MAIYGIGDLQGCYAEFEQLLATIQFDPRQDQLWLAGDLVNRGPDSLSVLRRVVGLGSSVRCVLGNHDLHLLAVAFGGARIKKNDTLDAVLSAPDADELLHWLRQQPLCQYDEQLDLVMTHAGVPPIWSLQQLLDYSDEVTEVLRSDHYRNFFCYMYGNKPAKWSDSLVGYDRLRAITNYLTRMRFCTPKGKLEFDSKEGLDQCPEGYAPWFSYPRRIQTRIIFGHWAALEGRVNQPGIFGLDTGCVWGGQLTAMNLATEKRYTVASLQSKIY